MFVNREVLLEIQHGDVFVHRLALTNVDQGVTVGMNEEPAGGIHVFAGGVVEHGEIGKLGVSAKRIGHEPLAILGEARDELVGVEDTPGHNDAFDDIEQSGGGVERRSDGS